MNAGAPKHRVARMITSVMRERTQTRSATSPAKETLITIVVRRTNFSQLHRLPDEPHPACAKCCLFTRPIYTLDYNSVVYYILSFFGLEASSRTSRRCGWFVAHHEHGFVLCIETVSFQVYVAELEEARTGPGMYLQRQLG